MVLVSLVLVVLAAVTLVIGLLQSGVTIIYISIGCSLVAGIVLFVAVRRGRPEAVPAGAGAPGGTAWAPQQQQQPAPAGAPAPQPGAEPVPAAVGAQGSAETATTWAPDSTQQLERVEADEYEAAEPEPIAVDGDLPIADYDRLRATDIMPLLVDLDADQLQQVRDHEESHKHRFTVLRRIDDELAAREAAEEPAGWEVREEEWQGAAAEDEEEAVPEPVVVEEIEEIEVIEEEEPVLVDDEEEVEELEAEPEPEPAYEPEPEPAYAAPRAGGFPIPDYDHLMMLEVLPRLVRLEADELLMVRQHEEAGLSRSTILNRIDKLLQQKGPPAERYGQPEPALVRTRAGRSRAPKAAASRTPARKAAAKRAPAKRSGIKHAAAKTPAVKRATSVKKAGTKKSAVKKAAVKKAAVKKAAVKKASGRKAAAKTLGPVKKTTPRKTR